MKNKGKIVLIAFLIIFILGIIGGVVYFNYSLTSPSKESEEVIFDIEAGTGKQTVIKNLKEAGLIRNEKTTLIYVFFHKDLNIQAGTYLLNKNMNLKDILAKFHKGDVKLDTVNLTLTGGQNVNDLIKIINKTFGYPESEIKAVFEDQSFAQSLQENYPFLTNDIINDNIYYALEGYLYPDTYTYLETASVSDIIKKMLDNTKVKLNSIENEITNSKYSIHEIMTKASIIELEAKTKSDREMVSQVIDYRLSNSWFGPLGMDVTTYYAVQKKMTDTLTMKDINTRSLYNTRDQSGAMNNKLPVGPICNPTLESITAAINPSATNYAWFVANVCTGEVFFQTTASEFTNKSYELRQICNLN